MEMIKNRLQKNWKRLKGWVKSSNVEAFRLYEKDMPEYPYIVDIYKDHAVIYEKGKKDVDENMREEHAGNIVTALQEIFQIPRENVVSKIRKEQKGKEQYEKLGRQGSRFVVKEGPALFYINLQDYLDTGLFLDHRPMRKKIKEISKGKKFLNLFSYTGAVSVYAALGGARTTSVDMSSTYQKWAQDNFELNQIDISKHQFIVANVIDFLFDARRSKPERYDVIFLDPPTFSNSKKMSQDFEVERDQELLVDLCMNMLNRDGVLYFSNNKRSFKMASSIVEKYQVEDISQKTIPADFRDKKIHTCFKISW